MTRIASLKRRRQGSKRLDLSPLKEILRDRRCWTCMGVVIKPDGEASHWRMEENDIFVEVETQPEALDLTCRLGATGGNGSGVWQIPNVGDEVAVVVPDGQIDFTPIIVAVLSSGSLPSGVAENVTVVANSQVLVHDGIAGAQPVATKADLDAVVALHNVHVHATAMSLGTPTPPAVLIPPATVVGTQVLRAK